MRIYTRGRSQSERSQAHWRSHIALLTGYSFLSLICVMGRGSGIDKRVLIDYNVSLLQDAVIEVFRV